MARIARDVRHMACVLASSLMLGACAMNSAHDEFTSLADTDSRYAEFEEGRVHYKQVGRGSLALVFIHGWACDMRVFDKQAAAFAGQLPSIYIDLPGHGQSPEIEGVTYEMNFLARSVEAVMRAAGVEQAIMIGHSNGTPVIREYYRLYPEKTRALVAVDGALKLPEIPPEMLAQVTAPLRTDGYQEALRDMSGQFPEDIRAELLRMMLIPSQRAILETIEAAGDREFWTDLRIHVPTLVVNAESPFWTEDYEQYVRSWVPTLDWRKHEGVTHFFLMRRPELLNQPLREFLAREDVAAWRPHEDLSGR